MLDRILSWFVVEPAISLLMMITAVVLFASALSKAEKIGDAFWPWLRRIIEASISAVLFIGLLWAFRAILNDNIQTFNATHGSLTEANRTSAWSIWGRPHTQLDLVLEHFIDVKVREEIPREDPTAAPVYRIKIERQLVPQNSIIAFQGEVQMKLSEREKGYALYSGYTIDADFRYSVINDSDQKTEAEFTFPLSVGQTLFQDFQIAMDGQDISTDLRFLEDTVSWIVPMKPYQESVVEVSYSSRGMDYFYYQIPYQREIKDFELILEIDRLPTNLLNYPERVLTPTNIESINQSRGSRLTWNLDHAVTTAGMGVALLQPEQPGAQVLRVLWNSPYALSLLGAMLALTLLIWGEPVHFIDLALLAAVYSVQFLIMAAVSDYFLGFWGSMLLGAVLTASMTFLLFRKISSKHLRILIYSLVGFFTLIYPLSGLLSEVTQRDSFDNLVLVGMILYIFGLSIARQDERSL